MTAKYRLTLLTPTGIQIADRVDFTSLAYSKAVNAVGALTARFTGESLRLDEIGEDYRIQVWRAVDEYAEYLELGQSWFVNRVITTVGNDQKRYIEVGAESALGLANRRVILYPTGHAQATIAEAADNAMKRIVDYNMWLAAGTGRTSMAQYFGIFLNTSRGASVNKQVAWRNVLQTLQELARDSEFAGKPIFFDFITDVDIRLRFVTWLNQPGIDRTDSIRPLSLEDGTLLSAQWGFDRSGETNVVYALGQEFSGARQVASASDAATSGITPFSRREATIDSRVATLTSELTAEAQAELGRRKSKTFVQAEVADIETFRYGIHWGYGDRLPVQVGGQTYNCLVEAISVNVSEGREQIRSTLRF